jgi:hypothetical protein
MANAADPAMVGDHRLYGDRESRLLLRDTALQM